VTRTPLSRSKGQRSRTPGRFTRRCVYISGSCSDERGKVFTVGTYCYVAVCRRGGQLGGAKRFGAHKGRKGAYRGGRPPAYSVLGLHCALSLAAQCIVIGPVCVFVCVCVCGSVTTITRYCMHRSSPNWVCREGSDHENFTRLAAVHCF